MSIKIINPGLLTTVQDQGRFKYQKYGMPVGGACDPRAATIANLLVDNDENEALLECTMLGPKIEFSSDAVIAITGGDLSPSINNKPIPNYKAVCVKKGDTLSFLACKTGLRAYIAFAGGLDIKKVMGSYATCLKAKIGGVDGRKLNKDDEIKLKAHVSTLDNMEKRVIDDAFKKEDIYTLRVILGPQDDYFTDKGIETFLSETYTVSNDFDRMGIRFEGAVIEHKDKADILSDGITFGAIQVPGKGLPLIMLADRQTTGGYTKIATVITYDFRILGQLKAGDKVKFKKITMEEAQSLLKSQKDAFKIIKKAFSNK